jgi:hypothetical protein
LIQTEQNPGDAPVAEVTLLIPNQPKAEAPKAAPVAAAPAQYASGTHLQQPEKILDEKYSASIHNRNR